MIGPQECRRQSAGSRSTFSSPAFTGTSVFYHFLHLFTRSSGSISSRRKQTRKIIQTTSGKWKSPEKVRSLFQSISFTSFSSLLLLPFFPLPLQLKTISKTLTLIPHILRNPNSTSDLLLLRQVRHDLRRRPPRPRRLRHRPQAPLPRLPQPPPPLPRRP